MPLAALFSFRRTIKARQMPHSIMFNQRYRGSPSNGFVLFWQSRAPANSKRVSFGTKWCASERVYALILQRERSRARSQNVLARSYLAAPAKKIQRSARSVYLSAIWHLTLSKRIYTLEKKKASA
jgi:hypothetical protein